MAERTRQGRRHLFLLSVDCISLRWTFVVSAYVFVGLSICEAAHPCNDTSAIFLPEEGQCLLPVMTPKTWIEAQNFCKISGAQWQGKLYRLTPGGELFGGEPGNPALQGCLNALSQSIKDFWIGTVSVRSPNWINVNGSVLNKIRYVTNDTGAFAFTSGREICSAYLNVDFCVAYCHDNASANYTVLQWRGTSPCCRCSSSLNLDRVSDPIDPYLTRGSSTFYVASAKKSESTLIDINAEDLFSGTQTLCATVDFQTLADGQLGSMSCFTPSPFLCNLGNITSVPCDNTACDQTTCSFRVADDCVQRDSRPMTWYRARFSCQQLGGKLWTERRMAVLNQATNYLQADTKYWVGATDHVRSFHPDNVFGSGTPNYDVLRCGHMFEDEGSGVTGHAPQWKWSDTRCDQQKSYVCQFDQTTHTSQSTNGSVICPWPLNPVTTSTSSTTETTAATETTASSATDAANTSVVVPSAATEKASASSASASSLPLLAVIAACVSALAVLLCACVAIGAFCTRKKRKEKTKRKAAAAAATATSSDASNITLQPSFWTLSSSVPPYLALDYASERGGYDTYSTHVHSDAGSSIFYPG